MVEFLDVVDHNDHVIGRRPRRECIDNGLLHRAVTIFISNDRGEVFLQKRAKHLQFYPGFWTASCTGHVSAGETYLGGANRELKEELGIECELKELGKFMTPKWKIGNGTEWEFITVFEGTCSSAIALSDESEDGKFLSPAEFKQLMASGPETLTPDLLLALKYYPKLPI
jgi:isopentenyl-diphosphate Delta-isomerase